MRCRYNTVYGNLDGRATRGTTNRTEKGVAIVERLLGTKEVSHLTGLAVQSLNAMRCQGRGPKFIRLGRKIAYRETAIREWLDANTMASTSEKRPTAPAGCAA